jgi:hypothetical protein
MIALSISGHWLLFSGTVILATQVAIVVILWRLGKAGIFREAPKPEFKQSGVCRICDKPCYWLGQDFVGYVHTDETYDHYADHDALPR